MAIEVKKITELTALTAFTADTLFVVHDGQGARKATMQQLWDYLPNLTTKYYHSEEGVSSGNYSGAGAHNGIYRGACINARSGSTIIKTPGNMVTDAQYNALDSGDFTDMYIGDFWQCTDGGTTVNYRIAAFDYYLRCGDGGTGMYYDFKYGISAYDGTDDHDAHVAVNTDVSKHHIVIVPDQYLASSKPMNKTATTDTGYANTLMRKGALTLKSGVKYYSDAACTTEKGTLSSDTECNTWVTWSEGSGESATSGYKGTITITGVTGTNYYKVDDSKIGTGEGMEAFWKESAGGLYECRSKIIKHFGLNHLLCHRVYLTSYAEEGVPKSGGWYSTICELPTEVNMYGTYINAVMNSNNVLHTKYTVDKTQFNLFRFRPDLISNRSYFWLQDIATNIIDSGYFCSMANSQSSNFNNSGAAYVKYPTDSGRVRPVFCLVKSNG